MKEIKVKHWKVYVSCIKLIESFKEKQEKWEEKIRNIMEEKYSQIRCCDWKMKYLKNKKNDQIEGIRIEVLSNFNKGQEIEIKNWKKHFPSIKKLFKIDEKLNALQKVGRKIIEEKYPETKGVDKIMAIEKGKENGKIKGITLLVREKSDKLWGIPRN